MRHITLSVFDCSETDDFPALKEHWEYGFSCCLSGELCCVWSNLQVSYGKSRLILAPESWKLAHVHWGKFSTALLGPGYTHNTHWTTFVRGSHLPSRHGGQNQHAGRSNLQHISPRWVPNHSSVCGRHFISMKCKTMR